MIRNLLAVSALTLVAGTASAATYTDQSGDIFTTAGGGILDILSMDVNNDATSITFKFTLAGDIAATNWGKYMVIIDSKPGGDTAGNGWGRPISMSSGADIWLGGWADGGPGDGVENRQWDGAAWQLMGATYNATPGLTVTKTTTTITYSVLLADLGLTVGQTILFDGFSSGGGGGDGAIDSAANPDFSVFDWGDAYNAGGSNPVLSYTLVPTPGFAGLAGAAGLIALRRRR